jgi:hypothetical protein
MRELPFMQVAHNLEHQQNVSSIYEQMKRLNNKSTTFAAKPAVRKGLNYDFANLKTTAPYEGGDFQERRQGGATFKTKN